MGVPYYKVPVPVFGGSVNDSAKSVTFGNWVSIASGVFLAKIPRVPRVPEPEITAAWRGPTVLAAVTSMS